MRSLLSMTFFLCLAACVQGQAPKTEVAIPAGWQKVDAEGRFAFHLPQGMKLTSTERCEECAWGSVYSDDRIRLYAEYTSWNEEYVQEYLDRQPEYARELTRIDGRKAKIQSWRLNAAVEGRGFTTEVRFYGSDGKLLAHMSALCKERDDVETAKQIFRTADFPG